MRVKSSKNIGVPKRKRYDNAPYARLIAAEAEYLNARGWIPFVIGKGIVVWKDPKNKEHPDQRFGIAVAVEIQRKREPDEVRYDESAACGGDRVSKITRIYDAAKAHAMEQGHHVVFSGRGGRCIECGWMHEEA